jgi:hypothetical protein
MKVQKELITGRNGAQVPAEHLYAQTRFALLYSVTCLFDALRCNRTADLAASDFCTQPRYKFW